MDKKLKDYFDQLDTLFSNVEKEEYEEFKSDLMEHIEIQLSKNMPVDSILTNMGSPEEAAQNYFEEKRLFIALNSDSDVVPIEEVPDEYKKMKKRQRRSLWKQLKQASLMCLTGVLSILFIYFWVYIIYGLVMDHYFSYISFISIVSILTCYVCFYKKDLLERKYRWIISVLCLLSFFLLLTTNTIYYHGERINKKISIDEQTIEHIDITSDFPMEIITVPVTSTDKISFKIDGFIKHSQAKLLSERYDNGTFTIGLKKNALLDLFTQLPPLKLMVFVPQDSHYTTLTTSLKTGFIQLSDMHTDKIDVSIKKGEIYLSQISSSEVKINSHMADINLNGFTSDVIIQNGYGKNIIKNGSGNLEIVGLESLTNITDINSNNSEIVTKTGKVILNNTSISNLKIAGSDSIIVAENQIGNTDIRSDSGKIVLANMGGRLDITNHEATVIISQEGKINGEIINQKGLVKWVQAKDSNLTFTIEGPTEKITDTYSSVTKSENSYRIKNNSGEIYLYPMIK